MRAHSVLVRGGVSIKARVGNTDTGESAGRPFSRVQSLQPAATLRGENLKCLLPSTATEEGKWHALLEIPAERMAQLAEESISEMDSYA